MNEVEILQKIDHPNVVKMKQMYEDKGHYYIAMELMEGGQVSLKNTLIGELFWLFKKITVLILKSFLC